MSRPQINPDAPAYPLFNGHPDAGDGLTVRQAFVLAAMQGLLASNRPYNCIDERDLETIARLAVKMADAQIAELNRAASANKP